MATPLAAAGTDGARVTNAQVARLLDEVSDLLQDQSANPFRVAAYRRAAGVLRGLPRDVSTLAREEGRTGLEALPAIGRSLAGAIAEIVETGHLRLLDRLRGAVAPEELYTSIPGIGPQLARRIHEALGIHTLEELEMAAWDGRLAQVPGFGPRRVESLRAQLDSRLSGSRGRRLRRLARTQARESPEAVVASRGPSVDHLLSVDAEYRREAEADRLPRIAPRRFNPGGVRWLPVLHTERGPWHFHALFSNTPKAHRLGRTHDWVVIYWDSDGEEGQATVVTEHHGNLAGLRVVRGREAECGAHYLAAVTTPGDEEPR